MSAPLVPALLSTALFTAPPPTIQWATGFSNGGCEAHPHAGVQLADGGYLMVGDSVCYNKPLSKLKRSVFLVRTAENGTEVWQRSLGTVGYQYGKFAIELTDGTLLVATSMSRVDSDTPGYPFVERRALVRMSASGDVLHTLTLNASSPDDPGRRDGFMCVAEATDEMVSSDEMVVYATGYVGGDSGYNPHTGYDEQPMFYIVGGSAFLMKLRYPRAATAPPTIVFDRLLPPASLGDQFEAPQGMRVALGPQSQVVILTVAHATHTPVPRQFGFIAADRTDGSVRWARLHPPPPTHQWTQGNPFAFIAAPGGGYVAAGHTIEVRPASGGGVNARSEMPTGRAVKLSEGGDVVWDRRFLASDDSMLNTECYGVAALLDGNLAVTCGVGVEPEDHPKATPTQKTWRVFTAVLDSGDGKVLWATNQTGRARLQSNAGEYVIGTRDGGMVILIDANSWGRQGTGGNFGLMKLAPPRVPVAARTTARAGPTVKCFPHTSNIPAAALLEWPPPAPYSHVVKELGHAAAASPAACEAACIAYRNDEVSPVSGWTLCQSFTHLAPAAGDAKARCVAIVDVETWEPLPMVGATAGRVTWPPRACATAGDCSHNGECVRSACKCDQAWKGDRCQTLALRPTSRDAGLRMTDAAGRNVSSWGGSVLVDSAAEPPLYHMWASEMAEGCGIESWRSNSRVIHATSTDGMHYTRQGVVFEAFAHEPTVARAPSGEWVMWFTSDPEATPPLPLCRECSDGTTYANTTCPTGYTVNGPTYLSWATSPHGPWSQPQRLFAAQANETNMDTNFAAAILHDGSVVGIGRTGGKPTDIVAHLVTATHWRNPASYTGNWKEMLFPNTTMVDASGLEDPYVWHDARRRVFHAIFHNQIEKDDERLCGGHAYSEDGRRWTFTGTSWSNRVTLLEGDGGEYVYRFSRRERPHLVFDALGAISALTTGVQFGAHSPRYVAGEDACYTLLQSVGV